MQVKSLPTLVKSYDECILDITVYGSVVSLPQPSEEELKKILFEEFKQRKPMPMLEAKRYELSREVSSDYKILYTRELELQTNEHLLDLKSKRTSNPEPVDFNSLSSLVEDAKHIFVYDSDMHDIDRAEIIAKYDLETGDDLVLGVSEVERNFGSTELADDLILSDEQVSNLGVEEQVLLLGDDLEPDFEEEPVYEDVAPDMSQFTDEDEELEPEYEDVSQPQNDFDISQFIDTDDKVEPEYEDVSTGNTGLSQFLDDEDDESEPVYEDVSNTDSDISQFLDDEEEEIEEEYEDVSPASDIFQFSDTEDESEADEEYVDVSSESDISQFLDTADEDEDAYVDITDEVNEPTQTGVAFNTDISQFMDTESEPVGKEPVSVDIFAGTQGYSEPTTLNNHALDISIDDIDISSLMSDTAPSKEIEKPVDNIEPEPTDLRAFLRKHPRSEMDFVLKYFTRKQVNDALRVGKIIKKGNILRI